MLPDTLINHYACSVCFGLLIEDNTGAVVCSKYREDHRGYVSQWFVRHYRDQHDLMSAEVKHLYSDTKWAASLGIKPALHGAALQAQLNRNRHALGRDDTGL